MAQVYKRDAQVRYVATAIFAAAIAGVGAVMMGVTSSPAMKGAALLWLPAALQLMAGVWLGPVRGFFAGAIGAQAAGFLAYGGMSQADWIMNFIAGGFANSLLPAVLFRLFGIGANAGIAPDQKPPSVGLILVMMIAAVVLAFAQRPLFEALGINIPGALGYILPILVVLAPPLFLGMRYSAKFGLAILIAVFISFISAAIGVYGATVAGQSWEGAYVAVGIGWFWGDTVSAIVGVYALGTLAPWARERGIAPLAASAA